MYTLFKLSTLKLQWIFCVVITSNGERKGLALAHLFICPSHNIWISRILLLSYVFARYVIMFTNNESFRKIKLLQKFSDIGRSIFLFASTLLKLAKKHGLSRECWSWGSKRYIFYFTERVLSAKDAWGLFCRPFPTSNREQSKGQSEDANYHSLSLTVQLFLLFLLSFLYQDPVTDGSTWNL